jgi:cyanate permease
MDNPSVIRNNNYRRLRLLMSAVGALVGTLAYSLYENRKELSWPWMVGSVAVMLFAMGVMLIAGKRQDRNSLDAAKQNLYRD